MNKEILNIEEAYILLKEGLVLMDAKKSYFKLSKKRIVIKGENATYSLMIKEFLDLYKDSKFIVLDYNEDSIDLKRDEEYYSFKHKYPRSVFFKFNYTIKIFINQ